MDIPHNITRFSTRHQSPHIGAELLKLDNHHHHHLLGLYALSLVIPSVVSFSPPSLNLDLVKYALYFFFICFSIYDMFTEEIFTLQQPLFAFEVFPMVVHIYSCSRRSFLR